MATKITLEKRDEMFEFWLENQAEEFVAKKVKVCLKTVKKYRRIDKWDKRTEDIRLRTRAKADYDIIRERAKNLKLIRSAKDYLQLQIENGDVKVKLGDLDKLIRVELLLVGQPDSRPDLGLPDELKELTTEELRNLIGYGKEGTGEA